MSQANQSRTQIVKVKGVSFNYVQFLWGKIGVVSQAQGKMAYSEAMRLIIELIGYLPDSIKDEFRERAALIANTMNGIKSNKLPCLQAVPDFYIRGIFRNRILQTYCSKAFNSFIDDLSSKLNVMGYMENVERILEGQDDWYAEKKRQDAIKKRAATRESHKKKESEADKFSDIQSD